MARNDYDSILEDLRGCTIEEIDSALFEVDRDSYDQEPVSIETFIDDPYFLGDSLGPKLFPFWRTVLKKLYASRFYSPYREAIWSLPIGSGKTLVSNTSILYDIHRMVCLKNPNVFYDINPPGVEIVFAMFSAARYLAEDVNWESLKSMMEASPWFKKYCPMGTDLNRAKMSVSLAKNVHIKLGSSSIHALGAAVFGGCLDEANFQRIKSDQATESYRAILRRMESRFLQFGGVVPGKLFLVSSPKFSSDFLTQRILASKDSNSTMLVENVPIWEVRRDSKRDMFSGETFPVFVGSDTKDPKIYSPGEYFDANDPNVLQVPVEYKDTFTSDLVHAIMDVAGRAVSGAINLFKSVEKIVRVATVPHRFHKEVIELPFDDEESTIAKFADLDYFKNPVSPQSLRFLHLDLGIRHDRLGLAAVYAESHRERLVDRVQSEDGPVDTEFGDRKFVCDWLMYVKPVEGFEVPIYKIRDWLFFLKTLKYPIAQITTDQFQSSDLRQQLKLHGFISFHASVDKDKEPYFALRNAINAGKIVVPKNRVLLTELRELRYDGKKVDHPAYASKDGSDALAGAFWACMTAERITRIGSQLKVRPEESNSSLTFLKEQAKKANDKFKYFTTGTSW